MERRMHGIDGCPITVTLLWVRWCLKSPALLLFTQPFIQAQIKKKSKLRVTGLCVGDSMVTGEFPAQMASNAENASIWWRHHADVQTGIPGFIAHKHVFYTPQCWDAVTAGIEWPVSELGYGWVITST